MSKKLNQSLQSLQSLDKKKDVVSIKKKKKVTQKAVLPEQISRKDIAPLREKLLDENKGLCPLCEEEVIRPVLDHDHSTGNIRSAICSVCNCIIGAYENKCLRMGKKRNRLIIAENLGKYLNSLRNEIHPTFKRKKLPSFN